MKILFLVLICIVSTKNCFAFSKQYSGGDVYVKIKNKAPCFYIKNKYLEGKYHVTVFEDTTVKQLNRVLLSSNEYPNEQNCISLPIKYELKKPYLVVMEEVNGTLGFGKTFCLSKENNELVVQKYTSVGCSAIEKSTWESFLELFK